MQVIFHRNPTIFFARKFTETFGESCILFQYEGIRTTGGKSEHVKPSSTFMPSFSWNLIRSIAKHAAGTYCPTGSFCKGGSSEADGNQVLFLLRGWNMARTKMPVLEPGSPTVLPLSIGVYLHVPSVLVSLQAWRAMLFPQTTSSCHKISRKFFQQPWGFAFISWECSGQSAEMKNWLPWNQPQPPWPV